MSELRSPLAHGLRLVVRWPVITVLAGVLFAGCNAHSQATADADWSMTGGAYRVAAPPPRQAEMEDDGQEAQLPPLRRARTEPDDPSEPYSRNYGASPPRGRADPAPRRAADIPDDLPHQFRRRLASAMAEG